MVYAVLLLFNIFTTMVDTAMFPHEYREAANIFMTKAIVDGDNIYSLDVLKRNDPGLVYLYGPLESIIASVFVIVLRADIVSVHFAIAFISLIATAILMAKMAYDHTNSFLPPALAFLCGIYCHWRYGYIYAAPDSLGLFLIILFLFILSRRQFKARPYLAAIVIILAFFTKQYFAIGALTGFLYLLFVEKREAIKYAITGIVISAILSIVITVKFPLFWTYALYFLKGPGAGMPSSDVAGTAHNVSQVKYIGGLFICFFIVAFFHLIITVYRVIKKDIVFRPNLKNMDGPLVEIKGDNHFSFDVLMYIQMLVAAFILYYIGNNEGAFISYYLQLFVPALILLSVVAMDNIRISGRIADKVRLPLLITINLLTCLYTINRAEPRLVVTKIADIDKERWEDFYNVISDYDHKEVYYVPLGEYPVAFTDKYIYNTGMPFVISEKYLNRYNESEIAKVLFPHAGEIMQQHLEYREMLRKNVLDGKYDLIMYTPDMDEIFTTDDMAGRYKLLSSMPLKAGSWSWEVDLYILKKDTYSMGFDEF